MPSIVLLLAAGVALGPDGLGFVLPRELGEGLFELVSLAVAIILFEGGLNLQMGRLRHEAAAIRRLVTWGALITAAGGAAAAYWLLGWTLSISALFGTLVVVTGPTVIRPLLRIVPLRPRLATVLESEGLLIDPVGAILAAVALQIARAPTFHTFGEAIAGLIARVGFGAFAGLVFGLALVALLRWPRAIPEGLENLVALGTALVAYVLCEQVLSESGILAVTVAGVVVGNLEPRLRRALGEFQEHLTVGLIGLLFVLLAADVRLADVARLGLAGGLTVAALALVVRPLDVALCTVGSELSWRERAFLAWVGPRGVVAAAIASLAAAHLETHGVAVATDLRAMVFLTIGVTVIVQGGSAPLMARLLDVRAPGRDSWVLIGAEELARELANLLKADGTRTVLVDSNPTHCRAAETGGHSVIFGNALDPRTLRRMQLGRARAVLALTPNSELNQLVVREAQDEYGAGGGFVAVSKGVGDAAGRLTERLAARVLFDAPKDVARWNVRLRHGQTRLETFVRNADGEPETGAPDAGHDPYLILAVRRGKAWEPMSRDAATTDGDRVMVAIYLAERGEALQELAARGFEPAGEIADDASADDGG